MKVIPYQKC